MAPPKKPIPSYCLHKPTGQAVVKIRLPDGARKSIYLGKYGSEESHREYERLIQTYRVNTPSEAAAAVAGKLSPDLTILEALAAYTLHVEAYYPTKSAKNHYEALRGVREYAGGLLFREFSPRVFKAVRQLMIDRKLSRTTINNRMGKVAQFVKWCVAEDMAHPDQLGKIKAVPGLRKGRGEAKELLPIRPPAETDLMKVLDEAALTAADLARVQMLCGARAGELVRLKAEDVNRVGNVWTTEVIDHKGEWRGKTRKLYFGPKAQAVLAPRIATAKDGWIFANTSGNPYTVQGYRQAIKRACARVGVKEFGTHALRHYAATKIRAEVDIETARILLGHSDMGLTAAVYAQIDERKVTDAMGKVG